MIKFVSAMEQPIKETKAFHAKCFTRERSFGQSLDLLVHQVDTISTQTRRIIQSAMSQLQQFIVLLLKTRKLHSEKITKIFCYYFQHD